MRTLPKFAHNNWDHGSNLPATLKGWVYQAWFARGHLPTGYRITQIGTRQHQTRGSAAFKQHLELKIEDTAVGFALNPNLPANISSSAGVYFKSKTLLNVAARPKAKHTFDANFIKLDRPYIVGRRNVILQWTVTNHASSGTVYGSYVSMSNPIRNMVVGASCGAALIGSSSRTRFQLQVGRVANKSPVFFMLATENTLAGGHSLPLDLTNAGMAGCALHVDPLIFVATIADGSGLAKLEIPLPSFPSTTTETIYVQALHLSKVHKAGLATTNGLSASWGNKGSCNDIFSLDGKKPLDARWPGKFNRSSAYIVK